VSGKTLRKETLVAGSKAQGQRLDRFVVQQLDGVSRKAVKRALDAGQVFVDGRVERRANRLLQGGETITLSLAGEAPSTPVTEVDVLYRDEQLLVINKPAGLPAHPTGSECANALDLVRELLKGEIWAPGPILLHRLDADTTGVLLFALSSAANRELARQFAERQVRKTYLALVAGSPPKKFSISNSLKAGVRGRTVATSRGGQPAETFFLTLAYGDGVALVEASPKTGRTHQIRVHLAGEGYPLLGDSLYGGPQNLLLAGNPFHFSRHLLHALRLIVQHPEPQEELSFEAPLPEDFQTHLVCLERVPLF
jgi:23S rRNA pseudouridine1911/1915/1917 synthase